MSKPPMNVPKTVLLALMTSMLGACAPGSEQTPDEASMDREPVIRLGYCPPHLCGLNSDIAGSFSFHSKGDVPNAQMRLVEAYAPDGEPHNVRITRSDLELDRAGGEIITGQDLVGSRFVFEHVEDGSRTTLYLEAVGRDDITSYVKPSVTYSSYRFTYRDDDEPQSTRHSLCGQYPWETDFDLGALDSTEALLIQSESYDWHGRALDEVGDRHEWATLGCMGGAYAKKVLMGYDPHHPAPEDTTIEQNEAMLRLLMARYCDGENHTEPDTPIRWENEMGWSTRDANADESLELEALWDANGVVCLDEPRFATRAEVEADCGAIPRCDGFDPADHHLASYRVLP